MTKDSEWLYSRDNLFGTEHFTFTVTGRADRRRGIIPVYQSGGNPKWTEREDRVRFGKQANASLRFSEIAPYVACIKPGKAVYLLRNVVSRRYLHTRSVCDGVWKNTFGGPNLAKIYAKPQGIIRDIDLNKNDISLGLLEAVRYDPKLNTFTGISPHNRVRNVHTILDELLLSTTAPSSPFDGRYWTKHIMRKYYESFPYGGMILLLRERDWGAPPPLPVVAKSFSPRFFSFVKPHVQWPNVVALMFKTIDDAVLYKMLITDIGENWEYRVYDLDSEITA
jgi:hypothetical protein